PAVSINSTNGDTLLAPGTTTLEATAFDSDGSISKVEFYNGGTLLSTDNTAPYNYAWNNIAAGVYPVFAKVYDNLNATAFSDTIRIEVISNIAPAVSITAPLNNAIVFTPATVLLKAAASDADGSISKVEFYEGSNLLGSTGTAPYTFEWKNIAVGTYSVTAKATDNYNVSTTSTNIAITVKNNSLPTVNIANPVNGAEAIAPAAFVIKATASDTDGSISKVEFYEGGNLLGTSVSGPYTYNWNNVAKGNYTLTAKAYDDQNDVTTSASVLVNVKENSLPTVVITSPSSGASAIAPATFTISANANDADGSIRKVAFYNGASLIETDSTSPYSINWQNIAAGTYTLTAKAYDDLNAINTSAAVTVTVKDNSLPAVTITSPSNGSTAIAPASFVIKAAASDSDGNITKVEFYSGTTLLSTVTTNPYTYSWNNVTAGDYKITAKAFDNLNAFAVSSEVSVTVTNNTAPAVAIISPVSGTTAIAPASFTLKATASDSDGSIKKVEFYEGVSLLGADSISPYTYDLTALPIGVYTYTAKATDELGATTISTEVKISVHANSLPSVVISAPTDGAIAIAPALIQLKANASDSDGNISKVEFYEGSTLLGTATVSPYSYDWNAVAGSYTLTAKAYDDLNAVAVSPEVKITVKENSLPIVNIVSPATNTTYLAPATIAIKANASDTDGSISKVEFYNGNSLLGEDLTSPYSFDWAGVAVGEYIVTAKAYDNSNAVTTSDNIKVIVVNNFLPTVHITLPVKDTAYIVGTPVSINAVAADANGTINKVEFYANNNLIGTVNSAPFNFSWTNVVSGDYKVIAKAYDDQNAAAISDTVKIKVHENIKPMVMIIRPYDSDQFKIGDTILIVTHHHDDDGTVVKMEFYQNNILLGTDNTAPFDFEWTNVPKGAYSLTAKAYDNLGATEISMPVRVSVSENVLPIAQIVNPISTDVFAANSDIPIIAEAEDPFGRVEWVDFYHDGTKIASDSTSPFFITWKNVPAGSYRLVAEAHDDEGATTYSDDVLINVVNNQGPTVAITSPADSATFITGIDILIQAIASDDGSIKRVEFYRGKVLIATDSVTPYVAIWKNAGQGVYALTAKAYDNTGISTISQPITVKVGNNLTPIVMLMTPVNNAVYTSPAAIDMEAHAHDDDGVIDRVEFYNGTTLLGTDITEPYTYKWTNVGDGSYDLSVKAFDNLGAYSISNIATVTVEGNKLPVIAITSPTNGAVYNAPATLTIEAIAYDPNGTVTKVEFYRGNALLGEDLTSPYAFTWKDIDQGEYTITAKAYDNLNAVTTATAIKIVVNGPTTVPSDADNFKDITLFPMPFDSKVNLRFTTKEPGNAVLKIYNELGKEVCSAEIAFDQGEQNIEVNTEHLPNGIYFFTIQTNEHLLKKKILKLNLN
ncbi:MAG TPA: Ig-like domain-containing protein, partial [Bacteroidia bacterium]|nr:Ig-like domain-containing protein [Bacteroidia bacterium]